VLVADAPNGRLLRGGQSCQISSFYPMVKCKKLPNTRRCWSRERCLSPTPPIVGTSRLPKVPNFIGNPLFCLFQNKVGLGCLPCPYKKFKRKKPFHNFEIFGKTFLAILSMTKEKTDERSCVIVLDTFTLGVVGVVGGD